MSKNSSAKSYQNNKERLPKEACERHQNLSKERKEKKLQHVCERYKNLPENKNQKYVVYRKKHPIIIIRNLKNNDLEKSFDEEYKNILKNQF